MVRWVEGEVEQRDEMMKRQRKYRGNDRERRRMRKRVRLKNHL